MFLQSVLHVLSKTDVIPPLGRKRNDYIDVKHEALSDFAPRLDLGKRGTFGVPDVVSRAQRGAKIGVPDVASRAQRGAKIGVPSQKA